MPPDAAPSTIATVLAKIVHATLNSETRRPASIDTRPPRGVSPKGPSRRGFPKGLPRKECVPTRLPGAPDDRLSAPRARRPCKRLRDLHPLRRNRTGDREARVADMTSLRCDQAELDRV